MRFTCDMLFRGEVIEGYLVESPSQISRSEVDVRLELGADKGAPVQVPPPGAFGAQVVEATSAEWDALRAAGYELGPAKVDAKR